MTVVPVKRDAEGGAPTFRRGIDSLDAVFRFTAEVRLPSRRSRGRGCRRPDGGGIHEHGQIQSAVPLTRIDSGRDGASK
jgi:hypothetical protein